MVSQISSELIHKYIDGCHMLHQHGLVDAYGHLSVRLSPSTFLMSRYMAPALVAGKEDLVIYKVEDGEPVDANAPRGFSERYIHSEAYKAYPSITAVVHSHALSVIPFSVSSTPMSACFHMAGFLGQKVPVWDCDTVYTAEDSHDMLVRNNKLGASLARALGDETGQNCKHAVALMRGHGMVVVAESLEMVIFRSIYTAQNAQIQQNAIGIGGAVKLFSAKECVDSAQKTSGGAVKPWPLWTQEVEKSNMYENASNC
ncbi:arad-like aldolase/epimerase [Rhizodiscina lignyota]|uniref:Arad-like aldolase/epimerase n=1 Tax=Rhizodiscina lignyota TaxID=1504668 RepID=A0A9P4IIK5_9PEZI|nr:arad-like aldolase/epimerase [Rhizodiscina lignyota]